MVQPTDTAPDRVWTATKDDPEDKTTFNVSRRPENPVKWKPLATMDPVRPTEGGGGDAPG